MKRIWIMTLFPEFFIPLKECGVLRRAFSGENPLLELNFVQIRDYALGNYKSVDDYPFGGAPGMIMRPDILARAVQEGIMIPGGYTDRKKELHFIYTSPRGKTWKAAQSKLLAQTLSEEKDLVFLCGRYEGVDERFISHYIDEEISIGDYVLSGGEIAVMALMDSILRHIPGVLGNQGSLSCESFENSLLEAPQYTKPREFEGELVPEIYLSGHHLKMREFAAQEALRITKERRPDLLVQQTGEKIKK